MNKKIILSLSVIGIVAAIAVGGTVAYFSDTETNTGNLFKAGTIDIWVEGDNFIWEEGAIMEDMKPCYTDYINLVIHNDGSDPNPVNVWKKLYNIVETTGVVSEPECTEQGGIWTEGQPGSCNFGTEIDNDNISSIINYDLSVEVYNEEEQKIWWQTIYVDDDKVTVADIVAMSDGVYLGMIPVDGYMKVTQSYHMQDPDESTNWAQGDEMAFDIEIKGIQLRGTAWLENKEGADPWKLILTDDINGILTYEVKSPTFDFEFTGRAPLANHDYVLAAGYDAGSNVDTYLGEGMTDGDGDITITGDIELGKSMKDVKVWLVPGENWNNGMVWSPYVPTNFLWETGLIWYEDTDL